MSRYIDADAMIEYIKKMWSKWDEDDWYEAKAKAALKDDIEIVNKQPTIDAVPVVHGEWMIGIDTDGYPVTYCSNCVVPNDVQTHYCPNCGAKMDGGKGDDAQS